MSNVCKVLLFAFLFLVSSCGYALQGSGSILPPDIKTISVRLSENDTTVPGLGVSFTEKLRSRFERYGAVKVVDSGKDADAELVTRILSVKSETRGVTSDTDVEVEQEIQMLVSAELRKKNGQILYKNPRLLTTESFGTVSDTVVTSSSSFAQGGIGADTLDTLGAREVSRGQEDQTLDELMEEAARQLYLDAVAAEF